MKFSEMPYERVEYNIFSSQWNKLGMEFDEAKSGREQFDIHQELTALIKQYHTMRSLAYIRHTLNTQDETWSKEQDYYDENGPKSRRRVLRFPSPL